jgi:hypothetical protein
MYLHLEFVERRIDPPSPDPDHSPRLHLIKAPKAQGRHPAITKTRCAETLAQHAARHHEMPLPTNPCRSPCPTAWISLSVFSSRHSLLRRSLVSSQSSLRHAESARF